MAWSEEVATVELAAAGSPIAISTIVVLLRGRTAGQGRMQNATLTVEQGRTQEPATSTVEQSAPGYSELLPRSARMWHRNAAVARLPRHNEDKHAVTFVPYYTFPFTFSRCNQALVFLILPHNPLI